MPSSCDRSARHLLVVAASSILCACTGLPPLTLHGERGADAPSGPKVAALVAHLKCEVNEAANSNQVLPLYDDVPALTRNGQEHLTPDHQAFTLENIFKEIEYIGEATWTLDVTQTGAFSPSAAFSKYYRGAVGLLPATGAVLSVGGNLSEAAHRYITFNGSIDIAWLSTTEPAPFEAIAGPVRPLPEVARPPCSEGSELGGNLGLKETLADGLIAAAMNDISAVTPLEAAAPGTIAGGIAAGPLTIPAANSFGQISTQVDFTINEGVNGGPTWTLGYFNGPGSGSNGLLNYSRQVKDTLVVTFVPVCIRQKYWTDNTAPPYGYLPKTVEGTPRWSELLPPCGGIGYPQARQNASTTALQQNELILLRNALQLR